MRLRLAAFVFAACAAAAAQTTHDPRMGNAYKFPQGGWTYVHLEGSPAQIGFQHGVLLAPEIQDTFEVFKLEDTHETGASWQTFRDIAKNQLWPHIDPEYQSELRGIAEGLKSTGSRLDLWDIVAMNAHLEVPDYYLPWLATQKHETNEGRARPARPLLGAHRHRLCNQRRQDRDRPLQLVVLRRRRTLDDGLRHRAA